MYSDNFELYCDVVSLTGIAAAVLIQFYYITIKMKAGTDVSTAIYRTNNNDLNNSLPLS
jgi:hypothetical protein